MSFSGNNPTYKWIKYEPLSADPSSPEEGDVFYSDGTPRDEGLWVYSNGSWSQISTGATLSTLDNLTLTPQSAADEANPPLSTPTNGLVYNSDGTGRAAGLWLYNGTDWVQITGREPESFSHKSRITVRAASTTNVILASQVENGDSFGGVTLVTNDKVLLKNQTTSTENGVYVVQVSGAPVRDTAADDATELTYAQVYVTAGTNAGNTYWQTNVLSTLSDPQSWGTSAPTYSFTVPGGVNRLTVVASGGGGGGGGSNSTYGAGGGGAGILEETTVTVVPGDTLTVSLGLGGAGGTTTTSGTSGTNTTITGTGVNLIFGGGGGGGRGGSTTASGIASLFNRGGSASGTPGAGGGGGSYGPGGNGSASSSGEAGYHGGGGGGTSTSGASTAGAGGASLFVAGALGGTGNQAGGGGGSSFGAGGAGGNSGVAGSDATENLGGGGGGGGSNSVGGRGAHGKVVIYW